MEHSQTQSIPASLEAPTVQPIPADHSAEIVSLRAQVSRCLASHNETISQRDAASKELAQAIADRSDQAAIIARLRSELADVKPFPQLTRVQPAADLVVIRFPAGQQTAALRHAGFTVAMLKESGFRFAFDREGGKWMAKPTADSRAVADSINATLKV